MCCWGTACCSPIPLHPGRAIYAEGSSLTIRGGTIRENQATQAGGGIAASGVVTIERATVPGNEAPEGPDGIIYPGAAAIARCATIDLAQWTAPLVVDDSDCSVSGTPLAWGQLRGRFSGSR